MEINRIETAEGAQAPASGPDWRAIFDAALAERGPVRLAETLGYNNHTLVCRVAKGHVQASSNFQARVIDRLHVVAQCPATGLEQPRSECKRIGCGPAPTQNPLAMRSWKTCQRCPHKPESEES